MNEKKKYSVRLGIGLRYCFAGILITWLWQADLIDVRVVQQLDNRVVIIGIVLVLMQLVLAGWRLQRLLAEQSIRASMRRCITYNSIGIFYSVFLPGSMSGDLARAYYFWRAYPDANKSALLAALLVDRLLGTLALLTIGLLAATYLMKSLGLQHFVLAAWCVLLLLIVVYLSLVKLARYEYRFKGKLKLQFLSLLRKMSLKEYSKFGLSICVLSSIAGHFCIIILIYLCSDLMDSGLSFLRIIAIAPLGLLANALPITPGGIGIGEQGFELLYTLVGGSGGANSFLVTRLFLFAPAFIGAVVVAQTLLTKKARNNLKT